MLSKILKGFVILFTKPNIIGIILLSKFSFLIPDKPYLQLMYWLNMGKKLDLKNPKTFNEKLQWLKLYNHNPAYTVMVDKVKAKEYVAKLIGEEHIIPTLGVWDDPDDIDFDALPNQFVLKCNHNSGTGMCICRDKSKLDIEKVKAELRKGLKENYFMRWREWPYKNVPRKILAEKFMVDTEQNKETITKGKLEELNDYKIFCFNGEPKVLFVASDRANKVCFDYYDMDLKHLDLKQGGDNYHGEVKLPKHFEEMKELAAKISQGIPHVRTDFYEINDEVYVSERYTITLNMEKKKEEVTELTDYKWFCFNGEPFMMYVSHDNAEHATTDFFDMNYNRLPLRMKDPNSDNPPAKPKEFEEMREYAKVLSRHIPFLRVDFYVISHKVYFGELTFFHNAGFCKVKPDKWNIKLGKLVKL